MFRIESASETAAGINPISWDELGRFVALPRSPRDRLPPPRLLAPDTYFSSFTFLDHTERVSFRGEQRARARARAHCTLHVAFRSPSGRTPSR